MLEKNRRPNTNSEMAGLRVIRYPPFRFLLYVVLAFSILSFCIWWFNRVPPSDWHTDPASMGGSYSLQPVVHSSARSMDIPDMTQELFSKTCLTGTTVGRSIGDIYAIFESLKSSNVDKCQEILHIFQNMVLFDEVIAPISFPEKFIPQVKSWLGNDEKLFQQMYNQKIYKVVSRLSNEETIYNPLRSRRPVSKSGVDPVEYVEKLVAESAESCDFCRYEDHTATDTFGRVVSKYSASASNTFKLAKFHGLLFPLAHHPLNISYAVLSDLFLHTSLKWFRKAHEVDPSQRFPSLLWDSLPHAGASQVHPHVHGLLDDKQYAGAFEELHQGARRYYEQFGRSFWNDFVLVHRSLGLAYQQGTAVLIVPITARKDHEYWIISPTMDENVIKLLYRVLQAYRNRLNTFCHSSAAVYPVLGTPKSSNEGLPVIFRIGSRGDCTSIRSDISSLELYTVNNINTDLAETIAALEDTEAYLNDSDLKSDSEF